MENTLAFREIAPFSFRIACIENIGENVAVNDQHTHDVCEIYVNLSGDVSFMVEDTVYPIARGSIIITRPLEAHHCIYHSKKEHDHLWVLFSARGNEPLLDLFFARDKGRDNLIVLSGDRLDRLLEIARELLESDLPELRKYTLFFDLLSLLREGKRTNAVDTKLDKHILSALYLINKSLTDPISVSSLARTLHLSVRTFERQFKRTLGLTPTEYIRKRRLSLSRSYLAEGHTVSEAAELSGFSDTSSFIGIFKREYGMTPFRFKSTLA